MALSPFLPLLSFPLLLLFRARARRPVPAARASIVIAPLTTVSPITVAAAPAIVPVRRSALQYAIPVATAPVIVHSRCSARQLS